MEASEKTQYLLKIARDYKEYFTSAKKWDKFAKEHQLPTSRQYIHHFDTWNQAKQAANLPLSDRKEYTKHKYTKEDLIQIIKEHKDQFTSKADWNEYAKEKGLPHYETFWYNNIFWNDILNIAGKPSKVYSSEELLRIAEEHRDYFISRKVWDEFAKKHDLPNSYQYIKAFGNWIDVKNRVLKKSNDDLLRIAKEHNLISFSRKEWDAYAKKHNLPASSMYIDRFGVNWNKLKATLA